jgi:predicted nucleic acid-binding protein
MPATGKVVLDTSVVVAVLRRVPGLMERMRGAQELLVPLVALGELEYGINLPHRRNDSAKQSGSSWRA